MTYRLDKTSFKIQSFREADNNSHYWKEKTYEERLSAAWYLIGCAYNFQLNDPPQFEKNIFSCRKHKLS